MAWQAELLLLLLADGSEVGRLNLAAGSEWICIAKTRVGAPAMPLAVPSATVLTAPIHIQLTVSPRPHHGV